MKRLQLLFAALTIYILLQFGWWAYMLVRLNNDLYALNMELAKCYHHPSEKTELLHRSLTSKYWMIGGEGLVFISLLTYGIFQTYSAFKKEYALAKLQKNFLLSVTHEFKSPLAAVKLNIQTLAKHKLDTVQTQNLLQSTIAETDRLNELVENALTAARIDTHSFQMEFAPVNLTQLISTLVNRKRASNKSYDNIQLQLLPDAMLQGDELALTSIIENLIENAIKYSFDHPKIRVELLDQDTEWCLRVTDYGVGIEEHLRGKIFEKFFRIGNEETRNTKGTGLGLYIVKKLVEMHNGNIAIESNHPVGSIFIVKFPK